MIATCTCKSVYQDSKHGVNQRVCNPMKVPGQYRCTVCGKTITVQKAHDSDSKNSNKKGG